MTAAHTQRPLAGPLRARINKLAHSQALLHETRLKASLLEQVQAARDGGASFNELTALVTGFETRQALDGFLLGARRKGVEPKPHPSPKPAAAE